MDGKDPINFKLYFLIRGLIFGLSYFIIHSTLSLSILPPSKIIIPFSFNFET